MEAMVVPKMLKAAAAMEMVDFILIELMGCLEIDVEVVQLLCYGSWGVFSERARAYI